MDSPIFEILLPQKFSGNFGEPIAEIQNNRDIKIKWGSLSLHTRLQ